MGDPTRYRGMVSQELNGTRLDKALAALFDGLSRTRARSLIQRGAVRINGKRVRVASREVSAGEQLDCTDDVREDRREGSPLNVVEWGKDFVVCAKYPNQLVQGTRAGDTGTLERLINEALRSKGHGRSAPERAFVVHRLDAWAVGLVVLATQKKMAARLSEQLQNRGLTRVYWALVEGIPPRMSGTIDLPLGPVSNGRVHVDTAGRRAVTHWQALRVFPTYNLSLIECKLETGRTHQIRAHLAEEIGPIAGDWRYGASGWKRLRLASVSLAFMDCDGVERSFHHPPPRSFFAENFSF